MNSLLEGTEKGQSVHRDQQKHATNSSWHTWLHETPTFGLHVVNTQFCSLDPRSPRPPLSTGTCAVRRTVWNSKCQRLGHRGKQTESVGPGMVMKIDPAVSAPVPSAASVALLAASHITVSGALDHTGLHYIYKDRLAMWQ